MGKGDLRSEAGLFEVRFPHDFVPARIPTVQKVGPVVGGQLVRFASELELSVLYAIRDTTDGCTEVRCFLDVVFEAVVAEHDIGKLSIAVRYVKFGDDRPVV